MARTALAAAALALVLLAVVSEMRPSGQPLRRQALSGGAERHQQQQLPGRSRRALLQQAAAPAPAPSMAPASAPGQMSTEGMDFGWSFKPSLAAVRQRGGRSRRSGSGLAAPAARGSSGRCQWWFWEEQLSRGGTGDGPLRCCCTCVFSHPRPAPPLLSHLLQSVEQPEQATTVVRGSMGNVAYVLDPTEPMRPSLITQVRPESRPGSRPAPGAGSPGRRRRHPRGRRQPPGGGRPSTEGNPQQEAPGPRILSTKPPAGRREGPEGPLTASWLLNLPPAAPPRPQVKFSAPNGGGEGGRNGVNVHMYPSLDTEDGHIAPAVLLKYEVRASGKGRRGRAVQQVEAGQQRLRRDSRSRRRRWRE